MHSISYIRLIIWAAVLIVFCLLVNFGLSKIWEAHSFSYVGTLIFLSVFGLLTINQHIEITDEGVSFITFLKIKKTFARKEIKSVSVGNDFIEIGALDDGSVKVFRKSMLLFSRGTQEKIAVSIKLFFGAG